MYRLAFQMSSKSLQYLYVRTNTLLYDGIYKIENASSKVWYHTIPYLVWYSSVQTYICGVEVVHFFPFFLFTIIAITYSQLQNLRAANQDSFVLFVDIVKAFDSVNREMLWKILKKYGIPEKTIATIKKMYTNINIKISIEDAEFIFNSISGVKQGDNLAPVLFLFVVQAAIETMHSNWSTMSIQTPDLKFYPS